MNKQAFSLKAVAGVPILPIQTMKKFAVFAGLLAIAVVAQGAATNTNVPFKVGEKLTYRIMWGPFIAGEATLEVRDIEPMDGHDCYHLVAQAHTTGLADVLFHVESKAESWMDTTDFCTRHYRQNHVEGPRKRVDDVTYDYVSKEIIATNVIKGKVRHYAITDPSQQDVISSVYYARTQAISLNTPLKIPVHAGDTNVVVNFAPDKRKTLSIRPVGDVAALRMEPKPTLKIVAKNGGRLWLWVSDDQRKLPLLVTSELKFGSITLVLYKIESAKPAVQSAPHQNFAALTPP